MTLFLHFLDPPPFPMWHFLSIFTSEITNKNCPVTFLLTPLPLKCHVLFEWPLRCFVIKNVYKAMLNILYCLCAVIYCSSYKKKKKPLFTVKDLSYSYQSKIIEFITDKQEGKKLTKLLMAESRTFYFFLSAYLSQN